MRTVIQIGLVLAASFPFAGAAHAADSVALPDPNALTLLTLGLAGLLIGRRVASKRDRD